MTVRPHILLTNDDGIDAPGLAILRDAVASLGRVDIVAPDGERSAASHSITVLSDMPYREVYRDGRPWGHALGATPADCVKLAITHLFERPPDLVISGINPGANLGNNILYSGTVAAAREAAMLGVAAIAVSVQRGKAGDGPREVFYETAARAALRLARHVLQRGLPPGVLLNVNAPNMPPDAVGPLVVTRQGRTMFLDKMVPAGSNGSIGAFRNEGDRIRRSDPSEIESDDVAVERGMISVTPLHYDLTHEAFRRELSHWLSAEEPEKGLEQ